MLSNVKIIFLSPFQSKLNCEVLYDDLAFEVRWAIAGDSIVVQLVAKLEEREYMAFGVSGEETKTVMIGADPAVAWIDKETLKERADDYYLEAKAQCSGPTGACPDERLAPLTNSIRRLNAAVVNGYSIVTYQRSLKASDEYDKPIFTNKSQAIVWAIGPLNERNEVSFHSHWAKKDRFIDFGRVPKWNCPMPETEQPPMSVVSTTQQRQQQEEVEEPADEYQEPPPPPPTRSRNQQRRRGENNRGTTRQEAADNVARDSERSVSRTRQAERRGPNRGPDRAQPSRRVPTPAPVVKREAWEIPAIQCHEPEDGVFYAQMGPTGGKRGYSAITGHVGWGISWYINGLLIPEVNVVRGKTYTFVVEGGLDPEVSAKYHPFYITDDPVGGYAYKTPEEKAKVKIFAGARQATDGTIHPTGVGRLCHWTHQGDLEADDFESFGAYQRTLELKCDQGEPGVIQFTPDRNTPDTVYYQCFTHRYLGWKINVLDSCDTAPAASDVKASVVDPKTGASIDDLEPADDLEDSPSIRVETRVKAPNLIEDTNAKETTTTKTDATDLKPNNNETPEVSTPNAYDESQAVIQKNNADSYLQPEISVQPDISILLQPQSNYFPQPIYFQNPALTFSSTYNPLLYSPFSVENPQQSTFKSSPVNLLLEEISEVKPEQDKPISVEVSTLSTNAASQTTEEITANIPKQTSLEATPDFLNKSNIILTMPKFPHDNLKYTPGKIMISQSIVPPPPVYHARPGNFPVRQEVSHFSLKKPYHRPIMKTPSASRPFLYKFQDKPHFLGPAQTQIRPQSVIVMKRPPPPMIIKKVPSTFMFAEKPFGKPHPSVEISPLQASTEKEPRDGTTEKSYVPLIHIAPSKMHYTDESKIAPLRPAVNTGFHPESVVVEGGFKPIISKEIEDRVVNLDGPELEYESEIGVIDVNTENQENSQKSTQPFEPMFIPSPLDKHSPLNKTRIKLQNRRTNLKNSGVMFVIKHRRDERRDVEEVEDEIAEAAERVDTFYLPPANSKDKPTHRVMQPSNIDIPPGTVVSYDGRKVSGQSLTAKASERTTVLESRTSKASELIKAGPQFGPFKGDLPPLDPKFINKNAPQLQYQGVLHRDLESPSSSYLPQDVPRASTKLILVRQLEDPDKKEDVGVKGERRKREAHHTPEHTAEQEAQAKKIQGSHPHSPRLSSSTNTSRHSSFVFICANVMLVFSILKLF